MKMRPAKDYCGICTKSKSLTPLLEEAYLYDFAQTPNYGKLQFIIEKMLMDENQPPQRSFSWVQDIKCDLNIDKPNESQEEEKGNSDCGDC